MLHAKLCVQTHMHSKKRALTWVYACGISIKNSHIDKTVLKLCIPLRPATHTFTHTFTHTDTLTHTSLSSCHCFLPPYLYLSHTTKEIYSNSYPWWIPFFMHASRRGRAIISCLSYRLLSLRVCVSMYVCPLPKEHLSLKRSTAGCIWKKTLVLGLICSQNTQTFSWLWLVSACKLYDQESLGQIALLIGMLVLLSLVGCEGRASASPLQQPKGPGMSVRIRNASYCLNLL